MRRRTLPAAVVSALAAVVLLPAAPAGAAGGPVGGPALGTHGTVASPGATPLPAGLSAWSWVVADATTGTVLAARDPHGRYFPASTLKTLTALALLPALPKTARHVGTDVDTRVEGTKVGIVVGATYT